MSKTCVGWAVRCCTVWKRPGWVLLFGAVATCGAVWLQVRVAPATAAARVGQTAQPVQQAGQFTLTDRRRTGELTQPGRYRR
ncbi:hypothetical protein ACFXPY_34225 [Streptomyces sp. NPDC059153]|uniref:hypothetical protein n=1 Tax=Streptomyces sp. NPDC059153 TaxID=3346743 RepID=UPI00367CD6B2